jgi:hypothetical protein
MDNPASKPDGELALKVYEISPMLRPDQLISKSKSVKKR